MLHRNSYVATWKFQFCQFVVESGPLVVEFVRVTEVVVEIVETERTEPAIRLVVRFQPQRNNPLLCIECVLSLCPDHTCQVVNRDSSLASFRHLRLVQMRTNRDVTKNPTVSGKCALFTQNLTSTHSAQHLRCVFQKSRCFDCRKIS